MAEERPSGWMRYFTSFCFIFVLTNHCWRPKCNEQETRGSSAHWQFKVSRWLSTALRRLPREVLLDLFTEGLREDGAPARCGCTSATHHARAALHRPSNCEPRLRCTWGWRPPCCPEGGRDQQPLRRHIQEATLPHNGFTHFKLKNLTVIEWYECVNRGPVNCLWVWPQWTIPQTFPEFLLFIIFTTSVVSRTRTGSHPCLFGRHNYPDPDSAG